ncbi:hypothetical protein [Paenibacillus sp. 8b26]|uniref:hypothetical protein n=1 Tax=Paenibacillus sp. 8b26 TaxID=3424133 RepID=UPI003D6484BA
MEHIASILTPEEDKSSETAEWELSLLLEWVKQTYTHQSDELMVNKLLNFSRGFWKGLFTCYDYYYIPRTNNDLEQFFRRTKASHRRITGLRNWNSYIIRNGEMIVLVNDALRQEHVISRLRSVCFTRYKSRKTLWDQRLTSVILREKFNRNSAGYLNDLEQKWNSLMS